jgi:hypothetical protein
MSYEASAGHDKGCANYGDRHESGCCAGTTPTIEKAPIATIDLTPSWVAVVRIYLEMLEELPKGYEDKDRKRAGMKDEILRCAALADLYVKEHKR